MMRCQLTMQMRGWDHPTCECVETATRTFVSLFLTGSECPDYQFFVKLHVGALTDHYLVDGNPNDPGNDTHQLHGFCPLGFSGSPACGPGQPYLLLRKLSCLLGRSELFKKW